jgi:hypothetical protein
MEYLRFIVDTVGRSEGIVDGSRVGLSVSFIKDAFKAATLPQLKNEITTREEFGRGPADFTDLSAQYVKPQNGVLNSSIALRASILRRPRGMEGIIEIPIQ